MAIQPVCMVAFGIRDLPRYSPFIPSYRWIYIKALTFNTLAAMILPVLFLLLFFAAVSLPFSKAQRYLAFALALMQAVVVTIIGWTRWKRDIHLDWINVALARPSVRILGPMEWFRVREIAVVFSDVLTFLWAFGLLVFLVGLGTQRRSVATHIHASPLQAKLLRAAQFAALFEVIMVLGFRFYAAYAVPDSIYFDASLLAHARRLLVGSGIPPLGTVLILLVGLRKYQTTAKQPSQQEPTASAHSYADASSPEA